MKKYTPQELINFETQVAETFNSGVIKSPVHLYDGNEEQIIKVFENVKDDDWIFCTWRSHYQCLLKGVPQEKLMLDVVNGKSITLCYPDFNIYSPLS